MSIIKKFIVVDDDPFNNILCNITIESALDKPDITTFDIPEDALAFIQKEYTANIGPAILLLDINMPTLTGWEFMEEFEKFSDLIKSQVIVYIVSSSVDHRDKDKAEANHLIKGFISKPLDAKIILSIAGAAM